MNTHTYCYLCSQPIERATADNYKGHPAHTACIAAAPAVPRMWDSSPGVPVARCQKHYLMSGSGHTQCELEEGHTGHHIWEVPKLDQPAPTDTQCNMVENPDGTCQFTVPRELREHLPPDSVIVLHAYPAELVNGSPDAGRIIAECNEVCKLLLTKNRAYGSSFRNPTGVFHKGSAVDAINARMDDKIARMKQARDFSEDTELDLIGYLILKRILLKGEQPAPVENEAVWHSINGPTAPSAADKLEEVLTRLEAAASKANLPSPVPPQVEVFLPSDTPVHRCMNYWEGVGQCILEAGHECDHKYNVAHMVKDPVGESAYKPSPTRASTCDHVWNKHTGICVKCHTSISPSASATPVPGPASPSVPDHSATDSCAPPVSEPKDPGCRDWA